MFTDGDLADHAVHSPEPGSFDGSSFEAASYPTGFDAIHSVTVDEPGDGHPADATVHTYPGVASGDIAVASDGGKYIDAGPPKYDLDGDGKAETTLIRSEGRIVQVSDTNGDGRADEMLQVDPVTHQAAILVDDGNGVWVVAATGHIDATGDFVDEHSADIPGPPAGHGAAAGPAEPGTSGSGAGAGAAPADAGGHTAPDIVYTQANGTQTDLGAPNRDLDGDGVAESVAVRTAAGDILIVSDTNGDGHPDQLIQIDHASGHATWAVPGAGGGWHTVQTGHLASDGSLVADIRQGVSPVPGPPAPDIEVRGIGGNGTFDAGTATIDSNGDGVPDTVAVAGPGGSTIYYEDSNGDGVADKAWTTDAAGDVTSTYALDGHGRWVIVAAGGDR